MNQGAARHLLHLGHRDDPVLRTADMAADGLAGYGILCAVGSILLMVGAFRAPAAQFMDGASRWQE